MATFSYCFVLIFMCLVAPIVLSIKCYVCDYSPETSKGDDSCGSVPYDRYLKTFEFTPLKARKALPLPYQVTLSNNKNGYPEVPRNCCTLLVGISDGCGLMYRRNSEISVPSNTCRQIGLLCNPMNSCFCDVDKCNGLNNLEQTTTV